MYIRCRGNGQFGRRTYTGQEREGLPELWERDHGGLPGNWFFLDADTEAVVPASHQLIHDNGAERYLYAVYAKDELHAFQILTHFRQYGGMEK